jgi:hypothetical protein
LASVTPPSSQRSCFRSPLPQEHFPESGLRHSNQTPRSATTTAQDCAPCIRIQPIRPTLALFKEECCPRIHFRYQPLQPVTGIFGAHAVAVNASTGAVAAGTLAGWSCTSPRPAQFDGTYLIQHLPVGNSYNIYVEPLNGVATPSTMSMALTLCRNANTDPGWPPAQACVVPGVNQEFTAAMLPAP